MKKYLLIIIGLVIGINTVHASSLLLDSDQSNVNPNAYFGTNYLISAYNDTRVDKFSFEIQNTSTNYSTGTLTANLGYADTALSPGATSGIVWLATTTYSATTTPLTGSWWDFDFGTYYTIPANTHLIAKVKVNNLTNTGVFNSLTASATPNIYWSSDYHLETGPRTISFRIYGATSTYDIGNETISFTFPTNGITTPEPDNYVFTVQNLETETYYIKVTSIATQGTSTRTAYTDMIWAGSNNETLTYLQIPNPFADIMSTLNSSETSSVSASVIITRDPNFGFINIIDTDAITFTINNTSTAPTSTAASYAGQFGRAYDDMLKASVYENCGDWAMFCHLRNFTTWLLWGPNTIENTINNIVTDYKASKLVAMMYSTIEIASSSISENQSISDLYLKINIANQTSNIKIAGTSYFEDVFGKNLTNLYYNAILVIASIVVFNTIFWTILHI